MNRENTKGNPESLQVKWHAQSSSIVSEVVRLVEPVVTARAVGKTFLFPTPRVGERSVTRLGFIDIFLMDYLQSLSFVCFHLTFTVTVHCAGRWRGVCQTMTNM